MSQQVTCMYNSSNKEIMQSKANTEIHECGWCWEPIVRVGGGHPLDQLYSIFIKALFEILLLTDPFLELNQTLNELGNLNT